MAYPDWTTRVAAPAQIPANRLFHPLPRPFLASVPATVGRETREHQIRRCRTLQATRTMGPAFRCPTNQVA